MKNTFRDIGEGTIRRIDWQNLTPVVFLAHVPRIALGFRPLYTALIGVLLTFAAGYAMNIASEQQGGTIRRNPRADIKFRKPIDVFPLVHPYLYEQAPPSENLQQLFFRGVGVPWTLFLSAAVAPAHSPFVSPTQLTALLWFIFLILLWGFLGTGISRNAAMKLTVRENESFATQSEFMRRFAISSILSILLPVLGLLCCYGGGKLFALAAPLPGLNYAVAVLFPILLLIGLLFVCLGLALLLGFPLLVAAIAVEGSDAFDAVSRMYSYLRLRPLHYLFYTFCLTALGMLTYIVLSLFLDLAAGFAGRFVPGLQDFAATGLPTLVLSPHLLEGAGVATWIGAAWLSLFFLLKTAFTFTFFWTGAVAIYLLLRKSVDNAPLDEVYRMPQITPINPTGDTTPLPAPEIVADEKGMPELKTETKET